MPIYVQIWSGSGNGRVTDMTNAGKRGKTCRVLTFLGDCASVIDWLCTTADERAARGGCYALACHPVHEARPDDFDRVAAEVRALAGPSCDVEEREIRGVDAPRPKLTAGGTVVGTDGISRRWSAEADHEGIHLRELDDVNEWTEITSSKQKNAQAYTLASRVWEQVRAAPDRYSASKILAAAGCKLHGFCAMD